MEFAEIEKDLEAYLNGGAILQTIGELRLRADEANLQELQPLADQILNDRKFWLWPASKQDKHHAYIGGLALHALETIDFCGALRNQAVHVAAAVPQFPVRVAGGAPWRELLHRRWLFIAGLFHDYGKTIEYHCTFNQFRYGNEPESLRRRLGFEKVETSERGRKHSHVTDSVKLFRELVASAVSPGFAITHAQQIEEVVHMIHAHHGFKAWGSPVTPKTYEALILHQADMLSVFHDTGKTPMERD